MQNSEKMCEREEKEMFDIRILNQEQIKPIVSVKDAIEAVEQVYCLKAEGKTSIWPLVTYDFEVGVSDMDIKSGYIGGLNIFGMKSVSYFSKNVDIGLPNLIGILSIYDAKTGVPLGIMDASYITCLRTGAAGALGIKHLARKDATRMTMIGAGKQALFQMAAALTVRPNIERISIYDGLSDENAEYVAKNAVNMLSELGVDASSVTFEAVKNLENTIRDSDIIVTATPSRKPIVMNQWVKPGTHFSCVGSDVAGKQEIDENILPRTKIYVDDITQCINVGEIEMGIKKNVISTDDIQGEIGEVIIGEKEGRKSEEEITLYDTTGIAIQDLVTAKKVLEIAEQNNIGTIVEI